MYIYIYMIFFLYNVLKYKKINNAMILFGYLYLLVWVWMS